MTLTAINAKTKERYYSPSMADPRLIIPPDVLLLSPITGKEVMPIRPHTRNEGRTFVAGHFRHKEHFEWPEDLILDIEYSDGRRDTESIEHMAGKKAIVEYAYTVDELCKPEYAEPEHRFFVDAKGKYRIADVMFVLPCGWKIAHEVQFSDVGTKELEERTDDYLRAGVDVVWWFGAKTDTSTYHEWHREYLGTSSRTLRYRITGDLPGSGGSESV